MSVDDAIDVAASAVDCAVNDEPGFVHGSVRLLDEIAIEIDLDEVRGRHLLEQQPETVEQEMTGLARNARRNVGVDQIGPTEMLHQAVARGEIDALLPFGGIDVRPCGSADGGCDRRHSRLLDRLFAAVIQQCDVEPPSGTPYHFSRCAASRTMLRSAYVCTSMGRLRNPRSRCTSMLDCSAARSGSRSGLREYSLLVKSQPANSSGRSLVILAAICTASSWFLGSRYQRTTRTESSKKSTMAARFFCRKSARATHTIICVGPSASRWLKSGLPICLSSGSNENGATNEARSAFFWTSMAFMVGNGASITV